MFGGQARRGKRPSQCPTRECRAAPPPDMIDLADWKTTRVPGPSDRSARSFLASLRSATAYAASGPRNLSILLPARSLDRGPRAWFAHVFVSSVGSPGFVVFLDAAFVLRAR